MHREPGPSVLTPPGEEWPLLFKHTFDIRGSGFEAMVAIDGALLATITAGHCWLDGVFPYQVSEGDESLPKAYENLTVFMAGVLTDLAGESENFDEFEKKVQFFAKHPGDPVALSAWKEARQKIRNGAVNAPDIKHRASSGWKPSVIAVDLTDLRDNTSTLPAVLAAVPLRGELAA